MQKAQKTITNLAIIFYSFILLFDEKKISNQVLQWNAALSSKKPSTNKDIKKRATLKIALKTSWGPWCKAELNRLMPWIDKIWALHPYFPELMGKERTLQGAELLK